MSWSSFAFRAAAAIVFASSLVAVKPSFAAADPQSDRAKPGAVLFGKSGCTFCHGPAGMGTERAPSLRDVAKRLNDQQIRHQIHDGGQMMPPFGEALTDEEIEQLSVFLLTKDAWNLVPVPASPTTPR